MRVIVIFPGRFHPPTSGHKSVYDKLVKKFGTDNTFIASSDKQAPMSSPFTFEQKKKLWEFLGVPRDHVIQTRSPYSPIEITSKFDADDTAVVFALSEKDSERFTFNTKKDGSPSYMQPYSKKLKPLSHHGYVLVAPTADFKVAGHSVNSASDIRGMYIRANDKGRVSILNDLYGKVNKQVKAVFDKQLGMTETILNIISNNVLTESVKSLRSTSILAKTKILESRITKEGFNFKI